MKSEHFTFLQWKLEDFFMADKDGVFARPV